MNCDWQLKWYRSLQHVWIGSWMRFWNKMRNWNFRNFSSVMSAKLRHTRTVILDLLWLILATLGFAFTECSSWKSWKTEWSKIETRYQNVCVPKSLEQKWKKLNLKKCLPLNYAFSIAKSEKTYLEWKFYKMNSRRLCCKFCPVFIWYKKNIWNDICKVWYFHFVWNWKISDVNFR